MTPLKREYLLTDLWIVTLVILAYLLGYLSHDPPRPSARPASTREQSP